MGPDDLVRFSELDPDDMLGYVGGFPQTCRAAWGLAQDLELPLPYRSVRHVTVLGMGGSAIGGALLRGLAETTCAVPIAVVQGYSLPAFVQGSGFLVIACSYSGNTEETLAALGEAMERDVLPVVITAWRLCEWLSGDGQWCGSDAGRGHILSQAPAGRGRVNRARCCQEP